MFFRSPSFRQLPFALVMALSFSFSIAHKSHSARSYKEDKLIHQTIKKTGTGTLQKIINADKSLGACAGATLHSNELPSVICRLKIFRQITAKSPTNTPWEIKHRAKLAKAAYATAIAIDSYEPIDPPPRFVDLQYEATQAACEQLQDTMETLSSIRPKKTNKPQFNTAQETLEAFPMTASDQGLRAALCSCSKMWLNAADKAYRSIEEKGAIQRILTSRGCFLDMKKAKEALSTNRKAGPVQLSGNAQVTVEQNSNSQKIIDYAATRDFTLDRCRNKIGATTIKNPGKVQKCLCREVKRWRFPSHDASAQTVSAVLPIEKDLVGLRVNVTPKGKVDHCGPLEGPKVPPLKP